MNDKNFTQFPFLTREMLKFGNTSKMELVLTSIANRTLELTVKGITKSGVINIKQTTNPNSYPTSEVSQIDDIPIMVGIEASENELAHGEIYVSLSLKIDDQIVFNFVSGFITTTKGLSWPNSNLADSIPNRGFFTTVESADPAAGAEVYHTVPLGEMWHLLAVSFSLVCDSTVGNRRTHLRITKSADIIADMAVSDVQVADETILYSFTKMHWKTTTKVNNIITGPLASDLYLPSSARIITDTFNLQAADDYGPMFLLIEKFFTGSSF